MKKTKILVTGAYGFIGRYICKYYSQKGDAYVVGLGNGSWREEDVRDWGIDKFYRESITVDNLVRCVGEADIIVHCAGGGSVGFSMQNPNLDFIRTVDATAQVLEYARLHAPSSKIVYPSSAAVYGCTMSVPVAEAADLGPVSPYGVHKLIAENLCRMYAKNYKLNISIVRLFSIYGPELRKQLLWDACNKLTRGIREFPGTGEERRDWLHVSDAVKLLAVAVDNASSECPIINGGVGSMVTVREVLSSLKNELCINDLISFTGEVRAGDPTDLVADVTVAKQLGWHPLVDRREGFKDYVNWYKSVL